MCDDMNIFYSTKTTFIRRVKAEQKHSEMKNVIEEFRFISCLGLGLGLGIVCGARESFFVWLKDDLKNWVKSMVRGGFDSGRKTGERWTLIFFNKRCVCTNFEFKIKFFENENLPLLLCDDSDEWKLKSFSPISSGTERFEIFLVKMNKKWGTEKWINSKWNLPMNDNKLEKRKFA